MTATKAMVRKNTKKRNGRKPGPRTAAGKARSSKNALTHGLMSRDVVLPDEEPDELDALADGLRADLAPDGALEELLFERMVFCAWRLWRLVHVEAGRISDRVAAEREDRGRRAIDRAEHNTALDFAKDTDTVQIVDREQYDWGWDMLEAARRIRFSAGPELGRAFDGCEAALLARYENSLQRNMLRSLHELERLRARRAGEPVPAPLAVDVDVSGR